MMIWFFYYVDVCECQGQRRKKFSYSNLNWCCYHNLASNCANSSNRRFSSRIIFRRKKFYYHHLINCFYLHKILSFHLAVRRTSFLFAYFAHFKIKFPVCTHFFDIADNHDNFSIILFYTKDCSTIYFLWMKCKN